MQHNSHPPEGSHKLFVGGLPDDISEDELKTVFNTYGEVVHTHIMKANSMTGLRGAFVCYNRKESAEDAIKVLNGVYKIRVDAEAPIQVRWGNTDNKHSYQQQYGGGGKGDGQESNKLFAGSLPPDITEEELKTVFATYGELTSVHLMAPHSKTGMRAALIFYAKREAAEDAIRALNDVYKFREDSEAPINVKWGKDSASSKGDKGGWNGGGWGGDSWSGGGWNDGKGGSKGSKGGGGWQAIGGPGGWQDSSRGGNNWQEQDRWNSGGWQDRRQDWSGGGWQGGGGKDWGSSGYGGKDGGKSGGGKGWDHVEPSGKLFVGNLPEDIQDSALEYVFGTYGKVQKVHIMNNNSKNGAIAAFVEYSAPEEAETAIASLNERYEIRPGFGPIHVKHANNRRSRPY